MTDTLFGQTTPETNENEPSSYRELLVGEGKKFKTDEELAKGKYEADTFIQKLIDEKKQLESELAARAKLEDLLDQLEPPGNREQSANNQNAPQTPATVDETFIENILNRREKERLELQNLQEVATQLQKVFGTDYKSKLVARGEQLGMSKADLDTLAKKSPKAFLALVTPQRNSDPLYTPPHSSVNTPNSGSAAKVRSWEWYQNLKKTNPKVYWSPKVQAQLHKDAIDSANSGQDF